MQLKDGALVSSRLVTLWLTDSALLGCVLETELGKDVSFEESGQETVQLKDSALVRSGWVTLWLTDAALLGCVLKTAGYKCFLLGEWTGECAVEERCLGDLLAD